MNWLTAAFALTADLALLLFGGELKRRENISARLGDSLSQLYLASAVIKHFSDQGRLQSDLPLARWATATALHKGEKALRGAIRNFPNRWVGRLLTFWITPAGPVCKAPDDTLQREIAALILAPSASRDRLTDGVFHSADEASQRWRLDSALELAQPVATLQHQLRQWQRTEKLEALADDQLWASAVAKKLITQADRKLLQRYHQLQLQIIQVDSFSGRQVANP